MLIVKQDKTRKEEEGQIFVELTIYRDVRNIADCNRLGYWCDKAHLSHFIMECAKCFTQDELKNILKMNGNNIYIERNTLLSGKSLTTDFIGELSKRSRRSTNECISSSSRIT